MNYVCQALHPQRKGFIYSFSSSFHEKACITFTKKRVHLFSFILVSWESVHYICKETGSSFHFHHFMRKHALHAQRNNTFFIFILISWESVHYIHKKTGSSFHFHPHFMRKRALHAQRNKYIFSSSFLEKVCIMCKKKKDLSFHFHLHFKKKCTLHGGECFPWGIVYPIWGIFNFHY